MTPNTETDYAPSPREFVRDHVAQYEATGGDQGAVFDGRGVVILTTTGARSGNLRKSPVMRIERDGVYAAIASFGGSPRNPQWYHNAVANPDVLLQDKGTVLRMRAREVHGAEKEFWWALADEQSPNYAEYRAAVEREIPILVLEPVVEHNR